MPDRRRRPACRATASAGAAGAARTRAKSSSRSAGRAAMSASSDSAGAVNRLKRSWSAASRRPRYRSRAARRGGPALRESRWPIDRRVPSSIMSTVIAASPSLPIGSSAAPRVHEQHHGHGRDRRVANAPHPQPVRQRRLFNRRESKRGRRARDRQTTAVDARACS